MSVIRSNYKNIACFMFATSCGFLLSSVISNCIPDPIYFIRMWLIDLMTAKSSETLRLTCSADDEKDITKLEIEYPCVVRPTQIDRSLHMNNSMYMYELNFSRRHFLNSLGLWSVLKKNRANMVIQCQTIRYRREMKVLQRYTIRTRIVQVNDNEKCFYLESRFITPDHFVAAIHHAKYRIVTPKSDAPCLPSVLLMEADLLPFGDYSATHLSGSGDRTDADVSCSRSGSLMNNVFKNDAFVEHWERGNAVSSRELNPRKK